MDLLVQALLDSAIALGKYLATLPEQDRENVIAQRQGNARRGRRFRKKVAFSRALQPISGLAFWL